LVGVCRDPNSTAPRMGLVNVRVGMMVGRLGHLCHIIEEPDSIREFLEAMELADFVVFVFPFGKCAQPPFYFGFLDLRVNGPRRSTS
jgi:hypothetical protein